MFNPCVIYKCTKCHHEWQTVVDQSDCDWCGANGKPAEAERLLAENQQLRQALRLMHRSKSKSEFKRLCTQAGIDWAELIREEK